MAGLISDLTPASDASTALFEVEQNGQSKSATIDQVSAYVAANVPHLDPALNLSDIASPSSTLANLGAPYSVATLAALKALTARPPMVQVNGYATAGDGGGGAFIWIAGDITTPNDGLCVQCTSGPAGRYKRVIADSMAKARWFGVGLAGATDDTSRFNTILSAGVAALDISGCTIPLLSVTISPSSSLQRLFSDGTGVLTNASTSDSTTIMFSITKDDMWFDNVFFNLPASTSGTVAPAHNRALYFAASADQYRMRITRCRFVGSIYHVSIGNTGRAIDGEISDNVSTGSWAETYFVGSPFGFKINDNIIHDGGYCTGAQAASGAIRIAGLGSMPAVGSQITISRNIIHNMNENISQEAIDISGQSLQGVSITDNIIYECGNGGIEGKSVSSALSPDLYGEFIVSGNIIEIKTTGGIGVSLHDTGATYPAQGVMALAKISDNLIFCRSTPGNTVTGIWIHGQEDVQISNNFMRNVTKGIDLSANSSAPLVAKRIKIHGNDIMSSQDCINVGSGASSELDDIWVTGNTLIGSGNSNVPTLQWYSGLVKGFTIEDNYIENTATTAIDLRNVQNGLITRNTIVGIGTCVYLPSGSPNNVRISRNTLKAYTQVFSITVTGNGSGLTDGTRTFTVTNGTGPIAAQFTCTVSGGTITGGATVTVPGSYSDFPTSPTVTVDSGVVGGATFTASRTTVNMVRIDSGTLIEVSRNQFIIDKAGTSVMGTSLPSTFRNDRALSSSDPTGTYAGSVGDVIGNTAPSASGPVSWLCTTAGSTSSAVWSAEYNYSGYGGSIRAIKSVNFNSANTDNAITMALPPGYTRYMIREVWLSGFSATGTTATCGLFTATGAGGTAIVASGTAITVSSSTESAANNAQLLAIATGNTESFNAATLQFRVQTAQGSACTGNVTVVYEPVS